MTAPRAKTLQQRMGFLDPDLKSPKHDRLMILLDETIELAAEELVSPIKIGRIIDEAPPIPDIQARPINVESVRWEVPVMSGKFTVGFIDLVTVVSRDFLSYEHEWPAYGSPTAENKANGKWGVSRERIGICFEVKPKISSLGEVIRQIRHYQQYFNPPEWKHHPTVQNRHWFIASPDDRYADHLRRQEIGFYHLLELIND